jgi:lysyl-tRNA synthetase class II
VTGDAAAATVEYQGGQLDFSAPFRRAPMSELVREACGWDFDAWKGDLPGAKTAAVEALEVRAHDKGYHRLLVRGGHDVKRGLITLFVKGGTNRSPILQML